MNKGADANSNYGGLWYETMVADAIIKNKYLHEGEKTEDFFTRLGSIFADKEFGTKITEAMYAADFFLAGRSLYGAGAKGKFKASMSNCYILQSPEDSLESIYETCKEMARIFSYGGGVGVNISHLRPRGSIVRNSARSSTGAVSFMNIFNQVGEVVGAHGRRAAILMCLNCNHPDIEDFLTIKHNNDKIQSANISICFTDDFMDAVVADKLYKLHFFVQETGEEIVKQIKAREFFMKFAKEQYDWAEPASLFIDRINEHHLLSGYPPEVYKVETTNPCAEYQGCAYNACSLASVNLYNCIRDPFTDEAELDEEKFKKLVVLGVRALDEVLDYGYDTQPLEKNRVCIDDWRAIGLGLFGIADALVALGVRYGSKESISLIGHISQLMMHTALETSCQMAQEKGRFGKYDWECVKKSPLIAKLRDTNPALYAQIEEHGLRNGSLLSIAPTGTISTMCGHTGGIEPIYQVCYERTTHSLEKSGTTFQVYAKSVEDLLKHKGLSMDMSVAEIKGRFPYVVDTYDINPYDRVRFQAALQENVDNAISSTVNLKESTTAEDIFNLYLFAWRKGCKGITVFRDNCARISILGKNLHKEKAEQAEGSSNIETPTSVEILDTRHPVRRSEVKSLWGKTYKYRTACVKSFYVTVNEREGKIFEVFVAADSGCQANISTITRLTSYALRLGGKVDEIIEELNSAICPACSNLIRAGHKEINKSCASCIADALRASKDELEGKTEPVPYVAPVLERTFATGKQAQRLAAMRAEQQERTQALQRGENHNLMSVCPECGARTLKPEGKCVNCTNCGYSKCD